MIFRVIIAGGRDFNDYKFLCDTLDYLLANKVADKVEIEIVCGMARGADMLGHRYAKERGYKIAEFPADWNSYGKSAGYKRNAQMAMYADACACFWDGVSKGTKHMIDLAKMHNLSLKVIEYNK